MNQKENEQEAKAMGLFDHLSELRSRLVKSFVGVIVVFSVAMAYSTPILEFLKMPLKEALPDTPNLLHFTSPLEPFIAQLKVSFLCGFIFGSPIWIYQFWRFVEPALYEKEKKYVIPFALTSILLFFSGVFFCFYIMLPMALSFLISLGMESASAIITISDYISMIMVLIFAFGLIFETPLILILLALLDLIDAETLARNRRYVLVGILVAAALLTPPDPISQLAMTVPTYLMFEVAIVIIRFIKKQAET